VADINQITFSNAELLELLIKQANVHEGKWALMYQLALMPGMFPVSPEEAVPGGAMLVQKAGIQRIPDGQQPPPGQSIYLDAAKVNPQKGTT
jgi:hypothetical protein